ncbi:MAG: hypothetical protein PVS3B3_32400 [Ktedonobacteraceae bacterium]
MSNRDTQFAGFAKIVTIEIANANRWDLTHVERLIAQRAYDLVVHALSHEKLQWYPFEEIGIEDIPDLTEWTR